MAQLTIKINGYAYTVGCEDGQEAHLQMMATQIQQRIDSIKSLGGNPSGEGKLLVLAALLMADELHDSAVELRTLRQAQAQAATHAGNGEAAKPVDDGEPARAIARERRLAKLARKAEDIAASMERP